MSNAKETLPQRPRGRPRIHPIPDTPENVDRILMTTPPPN